MTSSQRRTLSAPERSGASATLVGQPDPDVLSPICLTPVSALWAGDNPRLDGESPDHVRALAEVTTALPPVIVHRATMRIIDGQHRWQAAKLLGQEEIETRFFDGSAQDAFVLGVRANIRHGLPLPVRDRLAAAERILQSHPHWSDAAVAEASGTAAKTVAGIRRRRTAPGKTPLARVGRDGRVRPISNIEGRRRAGELLTLHPDESLREIAGRAGISPGTVRDVRERLRRGEDVVPERRSSRRPSLVLEPAPHPDPRRPQLDLSLHIQKLHRDPAIRLTDEGRRLLRLLEVGMMAQSHLDGLLAAVPAHRLLPVADVAWQCSQVWRDISLRLEQRSQLQTDESTSTAEDSRGTG